MPPAIKDSAVACWVKSDWTARPMRQPFMPSHTKSSTNKINSNTRILAQVSREVLVVGKSLALVVILRLLNAAIAG
jgi:hypothetical protein